MTEPSDFMTAYKRHQETLKNANVLNKTEVFDALESAGITTVTVSFDGEGDSGQMDEVTAYAEGKPAEIPAEMVKLVRATWNITDSSDGTYPQESKLPDAIEDLCYDYLEQSNGRWENNDGAFGEFQFDVKARTIELEFNARFTDTFLSTHSF